MGARAMRAGLRRAVANVDNKFNIRVETRGYGMKKVFDAIAAVRKWAALRLLPSHLAANDLVVDQGNRGHTRRLNHMLHRDTCLAPRQELLIDSPREAAVFRLAADHIRQLDHH